MDSNRLKGGLTTWIGGSGLTSRTGSFTSRKDPEATGSSGLPGALGFLSWEDAVDTRRTPSFDNLVLHPVVANCGALSPFLAQPVEDKWFQVGKWDSLLIFSSNTLEFSIWSSRWCQPRYQGCWPTQKRIVYETKHIAYTVSRCAHDIISLGNVIWVHLILFNFSSVYGQRASGHRELSVFSCQRRG